MRRLRERCRRDLRAAQPSQFLGCIRRFTVNVDTYSELLRERSVFRAAPDCRDLIIKFVRELNSQMAQTADALNGTKIAAHRAAVTERVIGGDSGAEDRRGFHVTERVRNGRQRFDWSHHVLLIAAVIANASNFQVLRIAKIFAPARTAGAVLAAVPADADALAFSPGCDIGANLINEARDFVSRHTRVLNSGQAAAFVITSLWQTPQACTLMSTFPALGLGISR
jgi:hypothetical protein